MARYALGGIIIGIIGTILLFKTVLYTRDAAESAADTLGVARDTLDQSKIANRRSQRAYVQADSAKFSDSDIPRIVLKVSNTGNTPAHWFEVASKSRNFSGNQNVSDVISFDDVGEFARWNALGAGKTLTCNVGGPNVLGEISQSRLDGVKIVIFGIIRYKTIFGEIYETQFAFRRSSYKRNAFLARPSISMETYKLISEENSQA